MNNEKSLGTVISETKAEVKDFVSTRVQMLKVEFREKVATWKYAVPLLGVALALLLAAWITVTFALVALIRAWFAPSPYAWVWGGLIIAGLYLISAAVIGWFAYSEINAVGVAPARTLEVLKQDQVWIKNEARTA